MGGAGKPVTVGACACLCSSALLMPHSSNSLTPAAIHDGAQRVVARQGQLQNPPAQLSAVARLPLGATWLLPTSSGDTSEDALHVGAPQDAAAQAEHRAARLAQRRFARDVGSAVAQAPQRQQQQEARRLLGRPRGSPAAGGSQRRAELEREHPAVQAAQHGGGAGTVLKQSGNVRGPPAPPGACCAGVLRWSAVLPFCLRRPCRASRACLLAADMSPLPAPRHHPPSRCPSPQPSVSRPPALQACGGSLCACGATAASS